MSSHAPGLPETSVPIPHRSILEQADETEAHIRPRSSHPAAAIPDHLKAAEPPADRQSPAPRAAFRSSDRTNGSPASGRRCAPHPASSPSHGSPESPAPAQCSQEMPPTQLRCSAVEETHVDPSPSRQASSHTNVTTEDQRLGCPESRASNNGRSFPNGGDHREPPTQRAPQAPLPGWQIPPQTPYAPGGQSVEWVASSFPLKTPAPDTCLGEAS